MLTTKQLAEKEGVKVASILQSRWLKGEFRGFKPVGFKGKQYLWKRAAR